MRRRLALLLLGLVAFALPDPPGAMAGPGVPCGSAVEVVRGGEPALPLATEGAGVVILAVGGPRTLGQEEWRPGSSYPAMLAAELERLGLGALVVNAGQDNPSAAGSMARLADGIARHAPDLVIWEIGLADAAYYEGLGPIEDQLAAAIEAIAASGAQALLLDLAALPDDNPHDRPPDYDAIVKATAARYDVRLLKVTLRRDQAADPGFEAEDACIARLIAGELTGTGVEVTAAGGASF